jgi:hypothetical protein
MAKEKEIVDMESRNLDMVEAEFMNVRQSTVRAVEGGHIELQQVAALSIDGERVEVTQGASVMTTGENVTLNQSLSFVTVGDTTNLNFSCAPLSISAGETVADKSAIGVLAARDITCTNTTSLLLVAQNVRGNVTTLLDWRSALAIGAVAGGIFGLFTLFSKR